MVEIGTQYFNGASNDVNAFTAYQTILGYGTMLGGQLGAGILGSMNSLQFLGTAPYQPGLPTGGGYLYVNGGALWFQGPATATRLAPA